MPPDSQWVRVETLDSLPESSSLGIDVGGDAVALYRAQDGSVYASSDICTHEFARLSDGWLNGCIAICPLHGGEFDLRNGKPVGGPVSVVLPVYETRLVGRDVWLRVDPSTGKPMVKAP